MNNNIKITILFILISILSIVFTGCEREIDELEPATYPVEHEVFIDGFSSGLNYAAFGGSLTSAFEVVEDVTYNNSEASMRFEVPNANDPLGAYAGGVFYTSMGRNLTSFNALTFWIKASKSATVDLIGFGNDLDESKYLVTLSDIIVNSNWKKVIIPIPDPSKLIGEKGMLFYAEGPENDLGYTFWIDEVQFENLSTIAHSKFAIYEGNAIEETAFVGVTKSITGLNSIFNMPTGVNQETSITSSYFNFNSSNESIATIDSDGLINIVGGPGTAIITATVDGEIADGQLTLNSQGSFIHAPIPTVDESRVISLYSDNYNSVPIDYYNGYWEPYQTTLSSDFDVAGDYLLHYIDFNFVGIQFTSPTVDATSMDYLHLDIFIPYNLTTNAAMKLELVDATTGSYTIPISVAQSNSWVSVDIPLSSFAGLSSRATLSQLIFSDVNGNISSFYTDNIYFFN